MYSTYSVIKNTVNFINLFHRLFNCLTGNKNNHYEIYSSQLCSMMILDPALSETKSDQSISLVLIVHVSDPSVTRMAMHLSSLLHSVLQLSSPSNVFPSGKSKYHPSLSL